jgi:acetoin utilization protein AcuB
MFIERSMTKNVVTVDPEAGIFEARKLMEYHGFLHLPVVDGDGTLIGIVTDRDIRTAMPSSFLVEKEIDKEKERLSRLKIKDIMTRNPVTVSPANTIEDALLLIQKMRVGAFPVVDRSGRLKGILSIRDLVRAFINVLGIEEPGTFICIVVEHRIGQLKRVVDAITEEKISFGSVLVARHWEEGKRAIFTYLLTHNVSTVKKKLKAMGFELVDPMQWSLDQLPRSPEEEQGSSSPGPASQK